MECYEDRLCKCGCGGKIEKKKYHTCKGYKIPEFIRGHHIRINNPMHDLEVVKKFLGENSPNKQLQKRIKTTGINNGFYGKTHTDEQKKKWSEERIGTKRTKEDRIKQSIAISGDRHWNWRGGIDCEPYCDAWADSEYKESIKKRDGYMCLNPECNKITNTLCIHHIDYIKKNCHPFNLITICISCNVKANQNREWHKEWYRAIIERRYVL